MVSDRGKGAVEVSGGDQEGVALKAPVPVVAVGVFTVEASLLDEGGIRTGERQSLRDGPGGCPIASQVVPGVEVARAWSAASAWNGGGPARIWLPPLAGTARGMPASAEAV